MQLHAVHFPAKKDTAHRYERMARVLELSAAENSPATPLAVHRVERTAVEAYQRCKPRMLDNALKAKWHNEIIQGAAHGELLGMLDADTMVLRDLSPIEEMDFDVAYTKRPDWQKWKINTGVYFVRVNERTKGFCRRWLAAVNAMLANNVLHDLWSRKQKFGGIHQAALGSLLETDKTMQFLPLACEEWNAVNGCWEAADPRIVHLIYPSPQDWCFNPKIKRKHPNERRIVEAWRGYDRRVREAVA